MSLRAIKTPHLPEGKAGCVLIGEGYRKRLETPLQTRGVEVVWLPANPNVDPRLRWHADLSVLHLGENRFVAQGADFVNCLTHRGLDVISAHAAQGAEYPADTGLCGCFLGEYFIHKPEYTDQAVLKTLGGRKLIRVKQGYSRCAVCVVDPNSMITSDAGIALAAELHGIDVLRIHPGHIALDGFACGFLGGAAFKLSAHELAFTGTIQKHPDRTAILDFLSIRRIEPVYLTKSPIFDIGSAVPVSEQ